MGEQAVCVECGGVVFIVLGFFLGALFWTAVTRVANGVRIAALAFLAYQIFLLVMHLRGMEFHEALAVAGLGSLMPHDWSSVGGVINWLVQLPAAIKLLVLASLAAWIGTAGQVATIKPAVDPKSDPYEKLRKRLHRERNNGDFLPSRTNYGA
jgi:hypothetical protein